MGSIAARGPVIEPRRAFEDALRGAPQAAASLLAAVGVDPGWRLALQAVVAAASSDAPPLALEQVRGASGDTDALVRAALLGARRAFIGLDRDALHAWVDLLAARSGEDASAVGLARAMRDLLDAAATDVDLEAIEADAAAHANAARVVDVASLRALHALEAGDRDSARRHARRAVRMARTEELPAQQYLAGIALARTRRFAHQPHLAIRILSALASVVPPRYAPWVGWELALAGAEAPAALTDALTGWATVAPPERLARLASTPSPPFVGRDVACLRSLASLDEPHLEPAAEAWIRGAVDAPPRGLDALCADPARGWLAWVVVRPERRARRVIGAGGLPPGAAFVQSSRPGRLETAISVLALAPEGIDAVPFFEAVYRFDYEPAVHKGPLEVLVHRVRELLSEHAEVARDGPTLRLAARAPFVVPDPRARRSIDDTVLSSLARSDVRTARDAAKALGVPLRNVQHALKRLVEEGACEVERRGRAIHYRVEDTTFSEPTRTLRAGAPT